MKKSYQYIFWDLDGTIMDTYEGISKGMQYALAYFGIREEDENVLRTFIGPPLRQSIPEKYPLNARQTEVAVDKYREFYHDGGMFLCRPYPGVEAVLRNMARKDVIQAVTSSKPEVMCRKILKHFGLEDCFDEIVGASLDGKIDTKEAVLEEAVRRLKLTDLSRAVLIGDTKYDVQGAKALGIDCIGITYGFGTRRELETYGADVIFDTIEETERYLNGGE